ncbi:hypothetical protein BC827DRAFT_1156896 [Russula dissimulans]|nr:hypothetical protein BC827DRAFT_1156896 [Russula dissimulans]
MVFNTCQMPHVYMILVQITALPEEILLEVFDSYRLTFEELSDRPWNWNTLAHVCSRWRQIVFASSRRLDLWLLCTYGTPVRRALGYWPSLPIIISYSANLEFRPPTPEDEDNVVAALEHPARVRGIRLAVTSSLWERIAKLMQVPFRGLTFLSLWSDNLKGITPGLPNAFLGGRAPRLKDLCLIGISFPGLPTLLQSTRDLTSLRLLEIPDDGYISPHAMATCFAELSSLKVLCIEFHAPTLRHDQRHERLPPLVHVILPSLTRFHFRGASEYLESLVAQIDAPLLSHVNITLFNQIIFHIPHLSQFISRMEVVKSAKAAELESSFGNGISVTVTTLDQPGAASGGPLGYFLSLRIPCGGLDWQISSMAQICSQSSLLSSVEHLDIRADFLRLDWQGDMDSSLWLELFRSFTSVKMLGISGELGPHVAPALEKVAKETVTEMLPELCELQFECCQKSAPVEGFVTARRKSGRPVVVRYALFPLA